MMLSILPSALAGVLALAPAQERRDDLTPLDIAYSTRVSHDRKRFEIEIEVARVDRPVLHLAMPRWSPGAYGLRDTGAAVRELFDPLGAEVAVALGWNGVDS